MAESMAARAAGEGPRAGGLTGVKHCPAGVETSGAAQTYGSKRGSFPADPAAVQPFGRDERKEIAIMTRLISYDPFADAGFDDLFRGFFRPVRVPAAVPVSIRIDVTEKDAGYVVHAEIPGVKKEDIQVTIEGNQVAIAAEVKREAKPAEGAQPLRSERYYGSVYRAFTLPVELDEAASTAKYDNGILELTLARKAASAGRKIAIQ
jgi:HSP20 family protein